MEQVLVIAHRTCPRHEPENSIRGILKAAELGAGGVEIDVRLTRDGVPLLVHDRTLWRYLRLPIPTHWCTSGFLTSRPRRDSGEPITTFAAALGALPDGVLMAVEVKEARAVKAVIAEVRRQAAQNRVLLWARSMTAVREFAAAEPEIERALLRDTWTRWGTRRFVADAERCRADAISARWGVVNPAFVAGARERGLKVYAMATDAESQREKIAAGLDGVVTNWPEEALAAVRGEPA